MKHFYSPDLQKMGDCMTCGNSSDYEDHLFPFGPKQPYKLDIDPAWLMPELDEEAELSQRAEREKLR